MKRSPPLDRRIVTYGEFGAFVFHGPEESNALEADMSDPMAIGRDLFAWRRLAEYVSMSPRLRSLDLEFDHAYQRIEFNASSLLDIATRHEALDTLSVVGYGHPPETSRFLSGGPIIRTLSLRNVPMSPETPGSMPSLTDLTLSTLYLDDAWLSALFASLEVGGVTLRRLALPCSGLTAPSLEIIASNAERHSDLRAVALPSNRFGRAGPPVAAAIEILASRLTELDLSDNGMGDEIAPAVARAIAEPSCRLSRLSLARNDLTDDFVETLTRALRGGHPLRSLDLSVNCLLGFETACMLLQDTLLEEIDVHGNPMCRIPEVAAHLRDVLDEHPSVVRYDVSPFPWSKIETFPLKAARSGNRNSLLTFCAANLGEDGA